MGNVDIALDYAKRGWAVLPVYSVSGGKCDCSKGKGCTRAGKHPLTKHGVHDATTNAKAIKAYWKKWSNANIGVATGKASGIIVIDVDPRNGGTDTFAAAVTKYGPLPKTVKAFTGGGGHHLFFQMPNFEVVTNASGKYFGRGVDVLSDGAIAIVPPSVGRLRSYSWAKNKSPSSLMVAEISEVWANVLKSRVLQTKANTSETIIEDGTRNVMLTSLAGKLHRDGLTSQAVAAALRAENLARCNPPLDDAEVQGIVDSITSYPVPIGGVEGDQALKLAHVVLDESFGGGRHIILNEETYWFFDTTHWKRTTEAWIKNKILAAIRKHGIKGGTATMLHQVTTILNAHLTKTEDLLSYRVDQKPVVNTLSGELWVRDDGTVDLRSHTPESYLRHCLQIHYDPKAQCPTYDHAVAGIFSEAAYPRAMARHWNELLGYIIQPKRNIPMILICLGGGSNGKTHLLATATRLLGTDLVASRAIGFFVDNRFSMGSLFGKLMLLDDDVSAGTRLPDGFLKVISEAKTVTGEWKHGPTFDFQVRSVPVLLCNNYPSLADVSEGIQRRLMVVPFDKAFKGKEKDIGIFERIWANEMPGVLNRALEGLARLRQRGSKFKLPKDLLRANKKFLMEANPLPNFIDEMCTPSISGGTYLKEFYKAYEEWCQQSGITMKQQRSRVKQNLLQLGYKTGRGNKGPKVMGLKLNSTGL